MKLGFGTYRVNPKDENHFDSLKFSLDSGINTIEISSHYSDGEIEKKIAPLINEQTRLIVKAGYVQSVKTSQLEELQNRSESKINSVPINESNYYCIDPLYLDQEIDLALKNLNVSSLDTFHLHNPENLFRDDTLDIYTELKKSFDYLEHAVKLGKIKKYGISSNTFVLPKEDEKVINLQKIVQDLSGYTYFKSIQFPLNLLELGALEKQFDGLSLIEFAKLNNLEVIINRPLNAFTEKGLLRLAQYDKFSNYNHDVNPDELFIEKTQLLRQKFDEGKEHAEDKLEDIALFNQIKDLWSKQISKDAVDQIFFKHFFPLIANIWGKNLSSEESASFYDLYDVACNYARKNMNIRANAFKEQAMASGLLEQSSLKLQQMAIEKYRSYGVDLCLIGMRHKSYIEDFL